MSTKIYNAFCIEGNNYNDIQKIIDQFRIFEEESKVNCFIDNLVKAYSWLDERDDIRIIIKKEEDSIIEVADKLLNNSNQSIYRMFMKISDHFIDNDPAYYNAFCVTTKLFYRPIENKTLFLLTGAKANEIYKQFIKSKLVKDYSYWNNTDRPSSVSAKDWKIRQEDWEIIEYYVSDAMSCVYSNKNLSTIFARNEIVIAQKILDSIKSNYSRIDLDYINFAFKEMPEENKKVINDSLKTGSFSKYSQFERLARNKIKEINIFEIEEFKNQAIDKNKSNFDILNDILYKQYKYEIK